MCVCVCVCVCVGKNFHEFQSVYVYVCIYVCVYERIFYEFVCMIVNNLLCFCVHVCVFVSQGMNICLDLNICIRAFV